MKIKIYFLLPVMTALYLNGQCQNFVLGSTDPENDQTQSLSPDAKSIEYKFDIQMDSIWFRMNFFNRIDLTELNVKIGLDTNMNQNDGGTWQGVNNSMNYDLLLDIYHNPNFPPPFTGNILDSANSYISNNLTLRLTDTSSLVVGFSISEVIPFVSSLNVLAGCGLIIGSVDDDIPDTGFFTVNLEPIGIASLTVPKLITFPNPTSDKLLIQGDVNGYRSASYMIISRTGKIIRDQSLLNDNGEIDVHDLSAGNYILIISDDNNFNYSLFTKN